MKTMEGIRVVEVASWTFVPAAGAVLADWGADVLKIEHPVQGDPQRNLMTSGLMPGGGDIINFMIEFPNRGKRSVGIDIATDEGRAVLYRLCEDADVFLTNFMPDARRKLKIDVEDIQAVNPNIVYARGTGQGTKGPDAERGGYDAASFWSRGAIGDTLTGGASEWPIGQTAAFGDLIGGQNIAGGIAAALLHRERTGEARVVDISLLSTAMWIMQPGVAAYDVFEFEMKSGPMNRGALPNPLVGPYKTKDGRVLMLVMLQSDRYWGELVRAIGRPELEDDERFVDQGARAQHQQECVAALDEAFAERTFEEWKQVLSGIDGVWAPMQSVGELQDDPQAIANGYIRQLQTANGQDFKLVANPVQFDETPPELTHAPELGQHTEEVLLALGYSWEDLIPLKDAGAIS